MSVAVTHGRTATSVAACRAPPPESTARRRRPSPYPTSNLQPLTDNVLTPGPSKTRDASKRAPQRAAEAPAACVPEVPAGERIVEPNVVEPILATR